MKSLALGILALSFMPLTAMAATGVSASELAKVLEAQQTQSVLGTAVIQSVKIESSEGVRLSSTHKIDFQVAQISVPTKLSLRQIVWEQTATIEGFDNLLLTGIERDLGVAPSGEMVSGIQSLDLATLLESAEVKSEVKNDWIRALSISSRQTLGGTDPMIHTIHVQMANSNDGKASGCVDVVWRMDMTSEGVVDDVKAKHVQCKTEISNRRGDRRG